MSTHYRTTARAANQAVACDFGLTRTSVRLINIISDLARRLWPNKTAAELACRTDVSQRTAEYWLSGRCGLSADALASLLRSDEGLAVLEALMGNARPEWWRRFRRTARISQLRADIEAQRIALEKLERECGE